MVWNMFPYAVRRKIWITPCKRSAARGKDTHLLSELRRSSTRYGVEWGEILRSPAWRFAYTGLSAFKTFGLIIYTGLSTCKTFGLII
jgi:hypothetical protein